MSSKFTYVLHYLLHHAGQCYNGTQLYWEIVISNIFFNVVYVMLDHTIMAPYQELFQYQDCHTEKPLTHKTIPIHCYNSVDCKRTCKNKISFETWYGWIKFILKLDLATDDLWTTDDYKVHLFTPSSHQIPQKGLLGWPLKISISHCAINLI